MGDLFMRVRNCSVYGRAHDNITKPIIQERRSIQGDLEDCVQWVIGIYKCSRYGVHPQGIILRFFLCSVSLSFRCAILFVYRSWPTAWLLDHGIVLCSNSCTRVFFSIRFVACLLFPLTWNVRCAFKPLRLWAWDSEQNKHTKFMYDLLNDPSSKTLVHGSLYTNSSLCHFVDCSVFSYTISVYPVTTLIVLSPLWRLLFVWLPCWSYQRQTT